MSPETKRTRRIANSMKQAISETLLHRVRDPRIQQSGLTTVTNVQVSRDLRYAKVFISVSNEDETVKKDALEGFKAAAAFIRSEMGKVLALKRIPELSFFIDETLADAVKIEKILKEVSQETKSEKSYPSGPASYFPTQEEDPQ